MKKHSSSSEPWSILVDIGTVLSESVSLLLLDPCQQDAVLEQSKGFVELKIEASTGRQPVMLQVVQSFLLQRHSTVLGLG